jgi:hyperosmotically inducible periplasmic protein
MSRTTAWMTIAALACALTAGGCRRTQEGKIVVDQDVKQEAEAAGEAAKEGAQEVGQAAKEGLDRAAEATQEGLQRAEERLQPLLDDATVTAKVKTRLAADPEVSALRIDVDTVAGVVTLQGQVTSEAERAEAEKLARGAEGVRDVRNLITVGGGGT